MRTEYPGIWFSIGRYKIILDIEEEALKIAKEAVNEESVS